MPTKKTSKKLTVIIKEYKQSCFNCTYFKLKPLKYNEKTKQVEINFELPAKTTRCIKNMFIELDLEAFGIYSSKNTKIDNKYISLGDALKCPERYKKIANLCPKYDGEN